MCFKNICDKSKIGNQLKKLILLTRLVSKKRSNKLDRFLQYKITKIRKIIGLYKMV
jgi:hypothetical protein